MIDKLATINIEFEQILSQLFGKENYHSTAGSQDIKFLKRAFTKIFKNIERSIKINIYSCDQVLKDELVGICENALIEIKKPCTAELLNLKIVCFFTKLTFMLLGHHPNNWAKHKTNFNRDWKLDKYRCLNYTSNFQQKTFLILDNFNKHTTKANDITTEELRDKLNYEFQNDCFKFVSWFRGKYFSIYKHIM